MRAKRKAIATTSSCPCCPPKAKQSRQQTGLETKTTNSNVTNGVTTHTVNTRSGHKNAQVKYNRHKETQHDLVVPQVTIDQSRKNKRTKKTKKNGASTTNNQEIHKSNDSGPNHLGMPEHQDVQHQQINLVEAQQNDFDPYVPPYSDEGTEDSEYSDGSEEEVGQSVGEAINHHVRDIFSGGNRPLLVEPISTTIQSQIPRKIQKSIWANKYIDTAVL
ncbi:uncharacterized protein LOC123562800 [Mercenaria mercenaria]|uniref:uncharacterized protein LOC123562800 n=1 Tax=Mercenaria mercenaria TaxID=6596 RepID=UPI00234F97E8|nr:uncharacterized protein LOC123562800 [Mercenaria mercenaria]